MKMPGTHFCQRVYPLVSFLLLKTQRFFGQEDEESATAEDCIM
jgi:hypothetical protein